MQAGILITVMAEISVEDNGCLVKRFPLQISFYFIAAHAFDVVDGAVDFVVLDIMDITNTSIVELRSGTVDVNWSDGHFRS